MNPNLVGQSGIPDTRTKLYCNWTFIFAGAVCNHVQLLSKHTAHAATTVETGDHPCVIKTSETSVPTMFVVVLGFGPSMMVECETNLTRVFCNSESKGCGCLAITGSISIRASNTDQHQECLNKKQAPTIDRSRAVPTQDLLNCTHIHNRLQHSFNKKQSGNKISSPREQANAQYTTWQCVLWICTMPAATMHCLSCSTSDHTCPRRKQTVRTKVASLKYRHWKS